MTYSQEQYDALLAVCRSYKQEIEQLTEERNIKYYNEAKNLRREVAELKAENERLKEVIADQNELCWNCKKSVKEFAEKLKKIVFEQGNPYNVPYEEFSQANVLFMVIDELLKEYEE